MFAQKLGLDGIENQRAHRVKRNNRDSNTNSPLTIVLKLFSIYGTTKIFQMSKEQTTYL